MALIDKLKAIADAIREKTGITEPMTLDKMAEIILTMGVVEEVTSVFAPIYEKFGVNKSEYPFASVSFQSDYVSLSLAKEITANADGTFTLKHGYLQSTYNAELSISTLEDAISVCMTFSSLMDKTTSTNMTTLRSDRTCYSNAPITNGSFVNYVE